MRWVSCQQRLRILDIGEYETSLNSAKFSFHGHLGIKNALPYNHTGNCAIAFIEKTSFFKKFKIPYANNKIPREPLSKEFNLFLRALFPFGFATSSY